MGWVDSVRRFFFGDVESRVAGDWEPFYGSSGSHDAATGLVPFFSAIRHIVDFMSTLPVDAYRLDGDNRVKAGTPSLIRRLNEPGDIGVGAWIGQWAYSLAVHGNAVGWVTAIDGYGFPISIRWLAREEWQFEPASKQWYVFGHAVASSRVVHSPWIVPPGATLGISPLENFRSFWNAGLSAQEYADVSRGGGLPPATLKNSMVKVDAEGARVVQARAMQSFSTGRPFVIGKDWDFKTTDIPPNQMRFLDTLQLTANQTAAIFGIDPREIGGTGGNGSITYVNDESKSLDRVNNMRPYLVRWEQMMARLLPERQYVKFNVDATIRTDVKTRTEIIGLKLADGRMSIDEARALEDMPPLPNGQGQRYNVPAP